MAVAGAPNGGSVERGRGDVRSSAAIGRGSGRDAIELITEPKQRREGWRHLWLGDTGTGKTYAAQQLATPAAGPEIVLVHDVKGSDPEYPAAVQVRDLDALFALPNEVLELGAPVAFRGDAFAGVDVPVDEIAGFAVNLARTRSPVRLLVDELDAACSPGGRELAAPNLRIALTQGRKLGLSVGMSTQTPQRCPREVLDQSSSIGIFRLGPRALKYLDEVLLFDPAMLEVVPTLERGDFVIHRPGRPWDRIVYRF